MSEIIQFDNVSSGYGRTKILDGLSFSVQKGEVFGVIGPNGSGKTTMLNTLAGLIRPFTGKIIYQNRDISGLPPYARCHIGIGRTFQIPRPFVSMTVLENVMVATIHGAGLRKKEAKGVAEHCLETVGLIEKKSMKAGALPLLELKKLEVARALGTKPILLLLDEVAAGLTEAEVEDVMKMVEQLRNPEQSIIWIEHVLKVMKDSTDRLMCMAEGKNVICGLPDEVIRSAIVEEIYLGGKD